MDPAKVKFHSLKHSIATHLLDAGAAKCQIRWDGNNKTLGRNLGQAVPIGAKDQVEAFGNSKLAADCGQVTPHGGLADIGILFEMCNMIAKSGRRSDAGFR